jgi:hypothetical protein
VEIYTRNLRWKLRESVLESHIAVYCINGVGAAKVRGR